MSRPNRAVVYTDGACLGNPGPGGWAWAVPGGAFAAGPDPATTNQRMEVEAVLEALRAIPGAVKVVSDSTYVVKCFNDRWYEGWQRRGWTNSQKKPVANQDLWRPLIDLYLSRRDEIEFEWVKGHSGDAMNDVVDRLAVEAAQQQAARSGDRPPDSLGRADTPGRGTPAETTASAPQREDPASRPASTPTTTGASNWTAGWKVAVFGHKPPELGGYDLDSLIAEDVRRRMAEALTAWSTIHPDLVVLTGMGLGTEQLAAEVCAEVGIPFVAVLPYPDPDSVWPDASRRRYRALIRAARAVVTNRPDAPATRQDAGRAAGDRDRWMVGMVDAALVVWNGTDRSLGDLVTQLERRDLDVLPIAPIG